MSRQRVRKDSTTWQNNAEAQQAITHFGGEKEAPQLTAAKPTDGAARWMWNLHGRALEPDQIRSCMGGGAQQDANSETLTASGQASGEDSRTGASRAEQGTGLSSRSRSAVCKLTLPTAAPRVGRVPVPSRAVVRSCSPAPGPSNPQGRTLGTAGLFVAQTCLSPAAVKASALPADIPLAADAKGSQ